MSTLKVNTLEEATAGGATFFTAKAWVNFNGLGTISIRDDGNVSSLTDYGTANYQLNFSSSLAHSNYSFAGSVGNLTNATARSLTIATSTGESATPINMSTSSLRIVNGHNAYDVGIATGMVTL